MYTPDTNDRDDLINWLCWNDSNGCYTDADCELEGFPALTLEEAQELYNNQKDG